PHERGRNMMIRSTTADLDKLAHGQAIEKNAFLALLADPQAQQGLAQAAQVHDLLGPPAWDETPPPPLEVGWEELAAYLDGTLSDPRRRAVVVQFLQRQAPELLPLVEEPPTTVDFSAEPPTTVEFRRPAP